MLILQVRQSEVALADGRLDEAFALAVRHDVGRHRRGQRLITRLVAALVRRGREHADAGRYAAALGDCEKAAQLGGNLPEVVALRTATVDAMTTANRRAQRQAMALATARRHVDDGHLTLGEQCLGRAADDATRVGLLRDDIDRRRRTAAEAVEACGQAMKRGEADRAARELLRARAADPHHRELAPLARGVAAAVSEQFQEAMEAGRLDRAGEMLRQLLAIDPNHAEARQQQAVLHELGAAWRQVQSGAYAEAGIAVARLLPLVPRAPWLKRIAEQLRQADQAVTDLRIGPLAWLGRSGDPVRAAVTDDAPDFPAPLPMPQQPTPTSSTVPTQFLLHVDGVGSFLVLREPVVTIGPISSPTPADVPVVAEPTIPPITLTRVDDDYFMRTATAAAPGRLLASGQCLDLSPRCRLTFVLPAAASTTAALDLTGARLPRSDVRRVILMDQDLIIGPSSASHVVAPELAHPVVLHLSHGAIVCRSRGAVTIGGQAAAPGAPIPLGANVTVGGVSFVLAAASAAVDSKGSR